jgi:hypothetical protein
LNVFPSVMQRTNLMIGSRPKATLAVDNDHQDDGTISPDAPHYIPSKGKGQQRFEKLDMSHLLTQPVYSKKELEIQQTHREINGVSDAVAFGAIRFVRFGFDLASGYTWKTTMHTMTENDYIRRIVFLETVAGVPGMVAGMVRHLHSLRLMRRDKGWIHSLLAEAENERMHLLIALQLKNPGMLFRMGVLLAQAVALPTYSLAYLFVPSACHRFVGYLEEEAVRTYTHILEEIDAGNLRMFEQMPAPAIARTYYKLPEKAMLRDVLECIRADEAHHRDSNHVFGDLDSDAANTQDEPLRSTSTRN